MTSARLCALFLFIITNGTSASQLAFATFSSSDCSGDPRIISIADKEGTCSSILPNGSASLYCTSSNQLTVRTCTDKGCTENCTDSLASIEEHCQPLDDALGGTGETCLSKVPGFDLYIQEANFAEENCASLQQQITYYSLGCHVLSPYASLFLSCNQDGSQINYTKCSDTFCSRNCNSTIINTANQCREGAIWTCSHITDVEEHDATLIIPLLVIGWVLFGLSVLTAVVYFVIVSLRRKSTQRNESDVYQKLEEKDKDDL